MCQLFAISTSHPIQVNFCWESFITRGSPQVGNPDGWGVSHYQENDATVYREPSPAFQSPLVEFLRHQSPKSHLVISHVRRASQGKVHLKNTQPFSRTLAGKVHIFAHNGFVSNTANKAATSNCLKPIGDTDSERLFCRLLQRLESVWQGDTVPSLEIRSRIIQNFADEMRPFGATNFIYSDSITLFAHAHRETVAGEGISQDPGLYVLPISDCHDKCSELNAEEQNDSGVIFSGSCQSQALVATGPLDKRDWRPMKEGELLRIENGILV